MVYFRKQSFLAHRVVTGRLSLCPHYVMLIYMPMKSPYLYAHAYLGECILTYGMSHKECIMVYPIIGGMYHGQDL